MTLLYTPPSVRTLPRDLRNGDRLTQAEFHAAYSRAPEGFKAELIGGIVYMAPPLQIDHGRNHLPLATLFTLYEAVTPGVEAADNTTIQLGKNCEPQPDLYLRILPEYGGQSTTTKDDYVKGPPELIAEISHSSHAIDLHGKLADYEKYGVREYLVVSIKERRLHWFDLTAGKELPPDSHGVYRLRTFPGLWIDGPALLDRNISVLTATLELGLASPEHRDFVKSLRARRSSRKRGK